MQCQPQQVQESTLEIWERFSAFQGENTADVVLVLNEDGSEVHVLSGDFPQRDYLQKLKELGITAEAQCLYCG